MTATELDTAPCCLSSAVITDLLRDSLGFTGVILTDPLGGQTISAQYDEAEAAILALNAGADMLYELNDLRASIPRSSPPSKTASSRKNESTRASPESSAPNCSCKSSNHKMLPAAAGRLLGPCGGRLFSYRKSPQTSDQLTCGDFSPGI